MVDLGNLVKLGQKYGTYVYGRFGPTLTKWGKNLVYVYCRFWVNFVTNGSKVRQVYCRLSAKFCRICGFWSKTIHFYPQPTLLKGQDMGEIDQNLKKRMFCPILKISAWQCDDCLQNSAYLKRPKCFRWKKLTDILKLLEKKINMSGKCEYTANKFERFEGP